MARKYRFTAQLTVTLADDSDPTEATLDEVIQGTFDAIDGMEIVVEVESGEEEYWTVADASLVSIEGEVR